MSQINLQELWISYSIQNPPPVPGSPAEVVEIYNKKWEEYKHLMLDANPTLNRETHPAEDDCLSADAPNEQEEYSDEEYEEYEEFVAFEDLESQSGVEHSEDNVIDVADLLEDDGIPAPATHIADQCSYLIEQIEHLHGVLLTSLEIYRRHYDFCTFKAHEERCLAQAEKLLKIHELNFKALKKKTEVFGYLGDRY